MIESDLVRWCARDIVLINDQDLVPAFLAGELHKFADPAQLLAEYRRRDRAVAEPVPLPAQGCGSVHDHEYGGQPCGMGKMQVVATPYRIQPQRVDHCHQRAFGPRRDDLIE
jgi:hypothetical protein